MSKKVSHKLDMSFSASSNAYDDSFFPSEPYLTSQKTSSHKPEVTTVHTHSHTNSTSHMNATTKSSAAPMTETKKITHQLDMSYLDDQDTDNTFIRISTSSENLNNRCTSPFCTSPTSAFNVRASSARNTPSSKGSGIHFTFDSIADIKYTATNNNEQVINGVSILPHITNNNNPNINP